MLAYLAAHGVVLALVGGALTAAGTQLFYSALNTMTSDTVDAGSTDDAFARVGRVRGIAFGAGGLVGGWLLSAGTPRALELGLAVNAVTFVVTATLLTAKVPAVAHAEPASPTPGARDRLLRDRRYLLLLGTTFAFMLTVDLFLLATPVYAHDRLGVPGWAVGARITVMTVLGILLSRWVVRRTAHLTRTTCLVLGGSCFAVWSLALAGLTGVPASLRTTVLFVVLPLFCLGNLLTAPRLPALVGAIAPAARKGAYVAYFQYAFTAAQLAAPLVTALMSTILAAPWLVNAALVTLGLVGVLRLRRMLPTGADAQG